MATSADIPRRPIVDGVLMLLLLFLMTRVSHQLVLADTGTEESAKDDDEDSAVGGRQFIPTSDWQIFEPDQSLPPGLHVRLNLQTGVREAKLMDEDENGGQHGLAKISDVGDPLLHSKDELKHVLHKIDADDGLGRPDAVVDDLFRSIEEIRAEFDALNMTMRTESEIVSGLLEELRRPAAGVRRDDERTHAILQDLEYYVHQYDSAVDFVKMGGLALLTPLLNTTADIVRSSAAFLLGSAMQSNPSVQASAADGGLIQRLLNRLAVEPSAAVRNKVLYAVSCLLRRFPHAQQKFLELGGLQIVKTFFDDELGGGDDIRRLQLKTMTMLYDLVIEHEDVQSKSTEMNDEQRRRARQYEVVGMKRAITTADFCGLVGRSLSKTMDIEPFEYDAIEKILKTMTVMAAECRTEFSKLSGLLEQVSREYERLADVDDRNDIRRTVWSLMDVVGNHRFKEEL